MFYNLSTLQSLMGNDIVLSKMELIKRYRSLANVNYFFLQILYMLQFSSIGKDGEGHLYYS